jgi:hypothetical protein
MKVPAQIATSGSHLRMASECRVGDGEG